MKFKHALVLGAAVFLIGSTASAFDLGLGGKKKSEGKSEAKSEAKTEKEAEGPTLETYTADKDNAVKAFLVARNHFVDSQETALDAFGLKTQFETNLAEQKALANGNTNAENTEKAKKLSSEAAAEIQKKIASGEKLDDKAKDKLLASMKSLGRGALAEKDLLKTIAGLVTTGANIVSQAPFTEKSKALDVVKPVKELSTILPEDIKVAVGTLKTYIDYCKSQSIELPKDATAAMGGE